MGLRRSLAVLLTVCVGLSTAQLPASASSLMPAEAEHPDAATPTPAPARSASGDLVAPDPVSAQGLAGLKGERVEVVGRNGRVSYTSGPVTAATHAHLRIVDTILTRRGL